MEQILSLFQSGEVDPQLLEQVKNVGVNAMQFLKFLGILIFGFLLISSLARFLLGKKNQINHAVTSAIEIFFVYVVSVVIYSLGLQLNVFLAPLPLVAIADDYLVFFPILSAQFPVICDQVLHLLIIAFLVNLINSAIPKGQHLITWLFLRMLTVIAAIAVIYGAELLLATFVPQGLAEYAPMILLIVLIVLVLLGTLRLLVGVTMAFANPFFAALYTFFFSNFAGRALSKAILTTALLTGLVTALQSLGIFAVPIAASVLTAYIPLLLIVLGLWILIGHVFSRE